MNKTSPTLIRGFLLFAFLVLALVMAAFAYSQSRAFFSTYNVTQMQGLALQPSSTLTTNGEPGAPAQENPPEVVPAQVSLEPHPWDGASPVTMLVVGLDYGDWSKDREGPSRTDTMIVFTIDPISKRAGMLNIPRDLWVNIPGFGYGKINTAYYLGEANQMPGGGAALAVKTVEQFLGITINYFAQIDFSAFEKFIDEIDGVLIDVPYEIKIDPIGKYNTITLKPGEQRLYGPEALAYARARYTEGGDFDRAQRQQQVIMAVRRRVLKPSYFPVLLGKAPKIYNELASGIHTNMTFEEAIQFAWLARDIPPENIRQGVIAPPEQVLFAKSPDGTQDILKPVTDKIRILRDEIFGTGGLGPMATGDPATLMKAEAPRLNVLNGSYVEGLATRTEQYLLSQGVASATAGNAGQAVPTSQLVVYTGKPYTVRYLADLMKIPPENIRYSYNPTSQVDIDVILGADWGNSNPLP